MHLRNANNYSSQQRSSPEVGCVTICSKENNTFVRNAGDVRGCDKTECFEAKIPDERGTTEKNRAPHYTLITQPRAANGLARVAEAPLWREAQRKNYGMINFAEVLLGPAEVLRELI